MRAPRYEILLDPTDQFLVWDIEKQAPAEWAGRILAGLDESEAQAALRLLDARPVIVSRRKAG